MKFETNPIKSCNVSLCFQSIFWKSTFSEMWYFILICYKLTSQNNGWLYDINVRYIIEILKALCLQCKDYCHKIFELIFLPLHQFGFRIDRLECERFPSWLYSCLFNVSLKDVKKTADRSLLLCLCCLRLSNRLMRRWRKRQ